jgi:hypothetical protein
MKYILLIFITSCATLPDGATSDRSIGEQMFEADGCPTVQVYNNTYQFDAYDIKTLNSAKEGCKRHFNKDSCLVRFYKIAHLSYRAVCKTFKVE